MFLNLLFQELCCLHTVQNLHIYIQKEKWNWLHNLLIPIQLIYRSHDIIKVVKDFLPILKSDASVLQVLFSLYNDLEKLSVDKLIVSIQNNSLRVQFTMKAIFLHFVKKVVEIQFVSSSVLISNKNSLLIKSKSLKLNNFLFVLFLPVHLYLIIKFWNLFQLFTKTFLAKTLITRVAFFVYYCQYVQMRLY